MNLHGDEVNILMNQLEDIQRLERVSTLTDLKDLTVAHIAGMIEWRVLNSNRFDCQLCRGVLINGVKIHQAFLNSSNTARP